MKLVPKEISVSLIIPVWNDAAALAKLLPLILQEWAPGEVWVVDGGSRDGSADGARSLGVRVLEVDAPSRARQMNAGAAASTGDVLLFLHADTHLPAGARGLVADAASDGAVGGAFSRRFDGGSRFLHITCRFADWRGKWFGAFFGDRAIFATREAFRVAGAFPDQPFFEDFEFSRRLSRLGPTVLLRPPVFSSGRRFERRGPVRQTMSDGALTVRYLFRGRALFGEDECAGGDGKEKPPAKRGAGG